MIRNMSGQCHAPTTLFRQCFWLCFVSCCFLWFSDVYCRAVLEGHPVLHPLDCWPDHGYDFRHPSGLSRLSFYSDLGLSQHSFTERLVGDLKEILCHQCACTLCHMLQVLRFEWLDTLWKRERERGRARERDSLHACDVL